MTLVLDAARLVALTDRRDPLRERAQHLLEIEPGELVIPGSVSSEVFYLLGTRLGRGARLSFMADVASERFTIAGLDASHFGAILELEHQHAALDVGLVDLSVVVVSARYGRAAVVRPPRPGRCAHVPSGVRERVVGESGVGG